MTAPFEKMMVGQGRKRKRKKEDPPGSSSSSSKNKRGDILTTSSCSRTLPPASPSSGTLTTSWDPILLEDAPMCIQETYNDLRQEFLELLDLFMRVRSSSSSHRRHHEEEEEEEEDQVDTQFRASCQAFQRKLEEKLTQEPSLARIVTNMSHQNQHGSLLELVLAIEEWPSEDDDGMMMLRFVIDQNPQALLWGKPALLIQLSRHHFHLLPYIAQHHAWVLEQEESKSSCTVVKAQTKLLEAYVEGRCRAELVQEYFAHYPHGVSIKAAACQRSCCDMLPPSKASLLPLQYCVVHRLEFLQTDRCGALQLVSSRGGSHRRRRPHHSTTKMLLPDWNASDNRLIHFLIQQSPSEAVLLRDGYGKSLLAHVLSYISSKNTTTTSSSSSSRMHLQQLATTILQHYPVSSGGNNHSQQQLLQDLLLDDLYHETVPFFLQKYASDLNNCHASRLVVLEDDKNNRMKPTKNNSSCSNSLVLPTHTVASRR